jgi:hypothetical protein
MCLLAWRMRTRRACSACGHSCIANELAVAPPVASPGLDGWTLDVICETSYVYPSNGCFRPALDVCDQLFERMIGTWAGTWETHHSTDCRYDRLWHRRSECCLRYAILRVSLAARCLMRSVPTAVGSACDGLATHMAAGESVKTVPLRKQLEPPRCMHSIHLLTCSSG